MTTGQALQLDIFVDAAGWEGKFDSLEVWRSRSTLMGPYEPLTSDTWAPASIPEPGFAPVPSQTGPLVPISGKLLSLLINEKTPIQVTFSGSDPISFEAAASQLQSASSGLLTAFALAGDFYIQTTQAGAIASLRVVGGDAASILGLPLKEPESFVFGTDARVPLVHGTVNYQFTDPNGDREFFYKTRFFNTRTRTSSEFSLAFQGASVAGVDLTHLVRATIDVVDVQGNSVAGQSILIYNRFKGDQVAGTVIAGSPVHLLTDDNGHAETMLVRGVKISMALAGTTLVRDIDVPTDPSIQSFDMLDPSYGTDDLFKAKVPNLDYAVRRTL
jgi:hypothetical protein